MSTVLKGAALLSDLPERRIHFYVEHGIIVPGTKGGQGRGSTRGYTRYDITYLSIAKELSDYGMTISKIKKIIDLIKENAVFKGKYDPFRLKSMKEELDIFIHIFPKEKVEYIVEFKNELVDADQFQNYASCLTIDYGRIIDRINKSGMSDSGVTLAKFIKA
jgi:DNA-binding transcriptional MerR regulator